MKKFITVFLTPIVMLVLTIVKFPEVEAYLKNDTSVTVTQNANDSSYQSGKAVKQPNPGRLTDNSVKVFGKSITYLVIIQAFLLLATIFTYYITMYSPYNRYEELAKKRWFIINSAAEKLEAKYSQHVINFNILVPKRKFLFKIEPRKSKTRNNNNPPNVSAPLPPIIAKRNFTGKVFEVIWSYGEGFNKKLRMTTKQGVSGVVYEEARRIMSKDFTDPNVEHYNFTDKQVNLCKDLKMLASCPIVLRKEYVNKQKIKVLGVLNIEGTSPNSEVMVKDPKISVEFFKELYALSELCATLLE